MNKNPPKISRRDFIKIAAIAGGVLASGEVLRLIPVSRYAVVQDTRLLMGTIVNITLVANTRAEGRSAIETTYQEMNRLIEIFDFRNPDCELGSLNRDGRRNPASPELIDIFNKAAHISDISRGAFDVTVQPILAAYRAGRSITSKELELVDYHNVRIQGAMIEFLHPGMQATLDGIAKGRIVDAGGKILQSLGYGNILVEAGGDLVALGDNSFGNPWKIGVTNPRPANGQKWVAEMHVKNCAVATSGDYQDTFTSDHTLNHIIDPRTGISPLELCSATVVAPTLADADALGTTLMVLGVEKGLALIDSLPDTAAMVVTKDLKKYYSTGFPAYE
jgi:thiamine biosynthesis lipoprotein